MNMWKLCLSSCYLPACVATALLGSTAYTSSWYENKLEGWYYFEDPAYKSSKKAKGIDSLPETPEEAAAALSLAKEKLHQKLALALLNPRSEHVESYMHAQKAWMNQSVAFAAQWGKSLLQHPNLGDFIENPTTSFGILDQKQVRLEQRKALLEEMKNSYFLIIFYRGADASQQKAVQVAQLFGSINQWSVRGVAVDGKGLDLLPNAYSNQGLAERLGVEATPSFFVVNPEANAAYPVGAGLITVSDLEENIQTQCEEDIWEDEQ